MQKNIWYALCHIHLFNAVISVIVVLGYSPNQRCLKHEPTMSEAWSMPCNVDAGSSNEIWRHHRSELRPSHSDSKNGHEGLKTARELSSSATYSATLLDLQYMCNLQHAIIRKYIWPWNNLTIWQFDNSTIMVITSWVIHSEFSEFILQTPWNYCTG